MPIKVALQNIHGKKYREVVPKAGILNLVLPLEDPRYPVLRYVDPYGNTILNCLQMYPLLEELERLAAECSSDDGKEILGQVRELAIYCRDHPHTFLRFIGD
jgi:hypothetical protein